MKRRRFRFIFPFSLAVAIEAVGDNRNAKQRRRLCQRMKIADFRINDLRHTAACWMRMASADIH
jgi:hypothetical protein